MPNKTDKQKRTILGSTWKHPRNGIQLGIVAAETDEHLMPGQRTWRAYIGSIPTKETRERSEDEQDIAEQGAMLSAQEAAGFFSNLDIKKYKQ